MGSPSPYTIAQYITLAMILWMLGMYISIVQSVPDNEFDVAINKQNKTLCIIGICLSLLGWLFIVYIEHIITNYGQ